jgi:DNA-directed RNA polymerase subunit RPC12/RpoP
MARPTRGGQVARGTDPVGDVPAIVEDLDITLSRQARIGGGGKVGKGGAHEKTPIHVGVMRAADDLANTLITWARDISGETWWPTEDRLMVARAKAQPFVGPFHDQCRHRSCERMRVCWVEPAPSVVLQAAHLLLSEIPSIRKHPAASEILDEITDAVRQARHVVDRPADRQFLGPCCGEHKGVTCKADLSAPSGADVARCKVCGHKVDVAERRAWLLKQAEDRLFKVGEAARMMGQVGGIRVTEASIRGYIHRRRIAYHTGRMIRLGDLLAVVLDENERRSA